MREFMSIWSAVMSKVLLGAGGLSHFDELWLTLWNTLQSVPPEWWENWAIHLASPIWHCLRDAFREFYFLELLAHLASAKNKPSGGEWDSDVCSGMPLVCMEITRVNVTRVGHCQCLLWWANGTDQVNHRLHPPSSADHGAGQSLSRVHQDLPPRLIHLGSLRFTKRMCRGAVSIYFSCPMWTERWRIRLSQDREEKCRERVRVSWW